MVLVLDMVIKAGHRPDSNVEFFSQAQTDLENASGTGIGIDNYFHISPSPYVNIPARK
jgi:hypothetical protein